MVFRYRIFRVSVSTPRSGTIVAEMIVALVDVETIGNHFESLTDPRHERCRVHRLADVVVISICGIICGASGPTA